MAIHVTLEGLTEKVTTFIELMKQLPQYRFYDQSRYHLSPTEVRIDSYFDEKPSLPPSLVQSEVKTLSLIDQGGKEITITLLNCECVEMGNGHTIIYGYNYDVFAG